MTSTCGQFVDKSLIEKIILKSLSYYFDGPSGIKDSIKMAAIEILEHQGR